MKPSSGLKRPDDGHSAMIRSTTCRRPFDAKLHVDADAALDIVAHVLATGARTALRTSRTICSTARSRLSAWTVVSEPRRPVLTARRKAHSSPRMMRSGRTRESQHGRVRADHPQVENLTTNPRRPFAQRCREHDGPASSTLGALHHLSDARICLTKNTAERELRAHAPSKKHGCSLAWTTVQCWRRSGLKRRCS